MKDIEGFFKKGKCSIFNHINLQIIRGSYFVYNCILYLHSRVFKKPIVHVIGDSHIKSFENQVPFIIYNIGSPTAYNLTNPNSTTKSHKKIFDIVSSIDRKRDIIMLVFGEVDCRVHIFNQFMKKNQTVSINDIIKKTIENYGELLTEFKQKNIKFVVYGIPAAAKQENIFNYPFFGSDKIRSDIYYNFNEMMKRYCEEFAYPYIDIYSIVVDKQGFISEKYTDDEIHLNKKITPFVIKMIKKGDKELKSR